MSDLKRTGRLLDGTVESATVWAFQTFSAEGVDGFREGLTLHVFEVRSTEGAKVLPSVFLGEQYTSACLGEECFGGASQPSWLENLGKHGLTLQTSCNT